MDPYILVIEENPKKLQQQVCELISKGYRPQGGICHAVNIGEAYFTQALVKLPTYTVTAEEGLRVTS